MISDSPPDRELEWTDQGIQASKNLINRISRYFSKKTGDINNDTKIMVEKFINQIELNILNFSLNKCVADIYTIFNYLEKEKVFLGDNSLSKRILVCLYPIVPGLSISLYEKLFKENIQNDSWPQINKELLLDSSIELPIQINGKLLTVIKTNKGYNQQELVNSLYQLDNFKSKINNKEITKIINVQDKIINIIIK